MSLYDKYREIYNKEIVNKSKGIVFSYNPFADEFSFHPYSHNVTATAVEDLGKLMRQNLFFYAFGENEVVNYYDEGVFDTLEDAAKYAFKQRLPDRSEINDGLPGEALLDLLIQLYIPNAYKLAVRTLFRQDDDNEIKGYDSTYFTKDENGVSLWLGQAKLGYESYCKGSIHKDLLEKFKNTYLSRQLFFICDKPVELTNDAKIILEKIRKLNVVALNDDDTTRAEKLINCFRREGISMKIPCLLAYEKSDVYENESELFSKVMIEVESVRNYYKKYTYAFEGLKTEILFFVFPIEDIKRLRDKETGFYAGLC